MTGQWAWRMIKEFKSMTQDQRSKNTEFKLKTKTFLNLIIIYFNILLIIKSFMHKLNMFWSYLLPP